MPSKWPPHPTQRLLSANIRVNLTMPSGNLNVEGQAHHSVRTEYAHGRIDIPPAFSAGEPPSCASSAAADLPVWTPDRQACGYGAPRCAPGLRTVRRFVPTSVQPLRCAHSTWAWLA